jgi:hypothetical protein
LHLPIICLCPLYSQMSHSQRDFFIILLEPAA